MSQDLEEDPRSPSRLESILPSRLDSFVGERHRRSSPRRHEITGDLVGSVFAAAGLEVREQPIRGPFGYGRNIVGRRPGVEGPDRRWILGAHYDTVEGSPGADDNGVAVAGLLELAPRIAAARFRDTVELVAWDMEEQQGLTGAYAFGSRAMARDDGVGIRGVLDLEMIGCCRPEPGSQSIPPGFGIVFPRLKRWVADRDHRGDFLTVVADRRSAFLSAALAEAAARTGLPLVSIRLVGVARLIPDFYRSDHAAFWARRIPAVMLTDSADFRNPHYHQPSDTLDTLDFEFAARTLETVLTALEDLAGVLPEPAGSPPEPLAG